METFEHLGHWWLPETPDEIFLGRLTFDYENGPRLTLLFDQRPPLHFILHSSETLPKFDLLHGATAGHQISLCGCYVVSSELTHLANTSRLRAHLIVEGCHIPNYKSVEFSSVSLGYTYLTDWMNRSRIASDGDNDFRWMHTDPMEINLADVKLTFESYPETNQTRTSGSIRQHDRITISPLSKRHKLQSRDYSSFYHFYLRTYFSFATNVLNFPTDIRAKLADERSTEVKLYYSIPNYAARLADEDSNDCLFTFQDFTIDELSTSLSIWIDQSTGFSDAYTQYLRILYYRDLHVDAESLFLVQALEAFYRVCNSDNPTLESMISIVCTDLQSDHNGLISETIGDVQVFAKKAADTRNYLSHYFEIEERHDVVTTVKEYSRLVHQLKILLQLGFLDRLGFPPSKVSKLVKRGSDYFALMEPSNWN